jgi:hypothetical protein
MPDASSQLSRHLGPARSGNPAPPFLGSRLFFFSYPWPARSRIRAVRGMAPARTPAPADGGMVPHSESSRPRFGTRPGPCSSPCSPCEPGILSRRVGACRSGPYIQNLTDPNTCAILDSRDWDRTRHAERTGLRILLHRGAGCDPYPIKKKGKTSTGTHLSLHIMSRRLREWQPEEWPGLHCPAGLFASTGGQVQDWGGRQLPSVLRSYMWPSGALVRPFHSTSFNGNPHPPSGTWPGLDPCTPLGVCSIWAQLFRSEWRCCASISRQAPLEPHTQAVLGSGIAQMPF